MTKPIVIFMIIIKKVSPNYNLRDMHNLPLRNGTFVKFSYGCFYVSTFIRISRNKRVIILREAFFIKIA